jgi:CDP-glycerol glycerophosphotransferase (TagB/SpsB family)
MNFLVLKKIYAKLIPQKIRFFLGKLRIMDRFLISWFYHQNKKNVKRIKQKDKIHVLFIAMDISFWKNDSLFSLMQNHPRFSPEIFLYPKQEQNSKLKDVSIEKMKTYFQEHDFPYRLTKPDYTPDIIFCTQPYKTSNPDFLSFYKQSHSLFCYVPYAFWISYFPWGYDQLLQNICWKLFYPTELHRKTGQALALNKGKNIYITGYPLADAFLFTPIKKSSWPHDSSKTKKIIWAPHHSVSPNKYTAHSSFLQYANQMVRLAQENIDRVTIAFKPHPILKQNLYLHPEWGPEKTDYYFSLWDSMPNTFIADGDYIDLFKMSDALIHDCGSFSAEYLYTKNPCLFIGQERDDILCDFGKLAMEAHYTDKEYSPEQFLQSVVFEGNDPKHQTRIHFFNQYLIPPNNKSTSENIFDSILSELE